MKVRIDAQPEQPEAGPVNARASLTLAERALYVDGNLADARARFAEAYALAGRAGDAELGAAAALGLGGLWVRERRSAIDAAAVEARQLSMLRAVEARSDLAFRLRARLAAEEDYRTGRCDQILRIVYEARGRGEPVALAEALSMAHHCLLGPEHATARMALAQELLQVGSLTGRVVDVLMGLLWRTVDLFLFGDPNAERSYAELTAFENRHRHRAVGYVIAAMKVMLTIRQGDLAEAERLIEACAGQGRAAGDEDVVGWQTAQLVAVRWYQGRLVELSRSLAGTANSPTLSPVDNAVRAAQAVVAAASGDRRLARCALARVRGGDLGDLPHSSSWLTALTGVAEAAALLDDEPAAAQAYDLLLPYADLPVVASLGVACFGVAHHPLGVASLCMGRTDSAVDHFRAAVAENTALGHWPATTLSKARLSEALALRGDDREADAALAEAFAEAAQLGMVLPSWARPGRGPRRPRRTTVAACTRRGRRWRVEVGDRAVLVDDSVGIRHLATLMANPGVDVPAVDLTGSAGTGHVGQPVLDAEALRQYRSRLRDLREQIDEAEAAGDLERAGALRSDADWLAAELQANTGLGGRQRNFSDDGERARIAVGKAIRRALDRISSVDAVVGEELRAATQTGMQCCFRPPVHDG